MILKKAFLALVCLLFVAGLAIAQTPTGNIEGTVTDPNKQVVSGATVTVTEIATNRTITATTSGEGFYAVRNLAPGQYNVRVEGGSFKTALVENLTVQVGQVARADVALELGTTSETVNVSAEDTAVQVDTVRQTVDGVTTAQQIQALPLNSRNPLDLAELQPSVVVRDGGSIDPTKANAYRTVGVNGGSGTSTRITVDGIDVTDETVGTTTSNLSTDAVQEFQTSRSSFDLSTSLTSTGAVNIITRKGGNGFHGSAFHFFQNNKLSARQNFDQDDVPFHRYQQGYRFGGPIIKNKLFFFSNFENNLQSFSSAANSFQGPFTNLNVSSNLPVRFKYTANRLDYTINNNANVFYSHRYNDDFSTSGNGGFGGGSPQLNINTTNVHTVGGDVIFGNFTNAFRFGYVNFNNRIDTSEIAPFNFTRVGGAAVNITLLDEELNQTLFNVGPNTLAPQQTYQNNYQFKYDGSATVGNHVVRYGAEYNRIILGGFANFSGPPSLVGFAPPSPDPNNPLVPPSNQNDYLVSDLSLGPNSGFFTPTPAANLPFGGKRNTRIAWYAGDQWKIRPNFTLNAGVRWNYETNFFGKEGRSEPILDTLYYSGLANVPKYPKNAFSPQLGFAWDPFKDGKTSVRGGFYLSYENNIFNNTLFDTFARTAPGIGPAAFTGTTPIIRPDGTPIVVNPAAFGLSTPECASATGQAQINQGVYSCLTFNGSDTPVTIGAILPFLGALNNAVQAAYTGAGYNPNAGPTNYEISGQNQFAGFFPGDYNIPYAMQFNIGAQHQLAKNLVLSVDYVRNRGVGLPFVIRDLEKRRDASTFDEGVARARLARLIGTTPAGVNPTTIQAYINARAANMQATTISNFSLANDIVFPGVTRTGDVSAAPASSILRTRIFDGGFSLYQALQFQLTGRLSDKATEFLSVGGRGLARGLSYTVSYAFGQSKATDASSRAEFGAGTFNNRGPNTFENFGETPLSRRNVLTASASFATLGGVRLDTIVRYRSREALSLTVPTLNALAAGSNGIFITDINGDGSAGGGAPRPDFLPGTKPGDLGRQINSIAGINEAINNFNINYAGRLTPAGQRLVQAGIFSEDQLRALGAVVQPIPLAPAGTPFPLDNIFLTDLRVTRPIKIRERFETEPSVSIFNLFNNTPFNNTITGLGGNRGDLNFQGDSELPNGYRDAAGRAALDQLRGRFSTNLANTRQIQLGIRVSF